MIDDEGELIGGRYALGELLGVGGTGSVFAAIDRDSGADVAVKLLHPHLCEEEASREAFLREAAHVMELQHPNIVRVHAAGLHDAGGIVMPWIALDLLHGPTLREWVGATGRLSPADAAAVIEGMLAALGHAHEAGIVHRDVSPQNVILHGVGERAPGAALTADMVRVVDFGLADVTGRATLGSDVLLAADGDAVGVVGVVGVVGNAAYMSPEQAQGRPVRAVSDLYQVGAVLYFALTGRAPFPRATTPQVLQAHVAAPPPVPSALAPAARSFDRVVTRAMSKTPSRRYRDAGEFAAAVVAASALLTVPIDIDPSDDPPAPESTSATRVFAGGGSDGLDYLSPAAPAAPPPAPVRSHAGIAAGAIAVVVLALAGWAVFAATAAPAEPVADPTSAAPTVAAPSAEPSASASVTPPPADAPPAPATPADVAVPALHGSLADAEAALRTAGLALGAVTRVESAERADRVLSQNPPASTTVAAGARVDLTIASGSNVVPQVSGMSYAAALAQLESAGFVAGGERPASGSTVTASGTQPGAGTVLRIGVSVALVWARDATPSPRPEPTTTPTERSS